MYTAASKFYISALRDEHRKFGISTNDTTVAAVALAVAERVVRASMRLARDGLTSRSHHACGPLCKGVHSSLVHIDDGCEL